MFDLDNRLKDLRASIVGSVFMVATAIMGLVWISLGLYSFLSRELGQVWGPVVLGLICFVPMILFALVKTFARPKPVPPRHDALESNLLAKLLEHKAVENAGGSSPLVFAVVAVAAGFLATRFPGAVATLNQALTAYAQEMNRRASASDETQV